MVEKRRRLYEPEANIPLFQDPIAFDYGNPGGGTAQTTRFSMLE